MAKWGDMSICKNCGAPTDSHMHTLVCCNPAMFDDRPYAPLREVFDLALEQASSGKGAERHGNGKPFDRQPMMEISRMLGGPSGCFYQAMKKTQEASRMEPEAAKREILGAINYLAGAYLLLDEQGDV